MTRELEVEVFRAGEYGAKGAYSVDDLEAIARDYEPKTHDAPVTLDHEQTGPAFGWVQSLRRNGDRLLARLHSLSEDLVDLIEKGAYKKRSIELYREFPKTGRPYLRAVTFLGACSPEVGSEAWCRDMKEKPKGDWTANEAADFAKHCVL